MRTFTKDELKEILRLHDMWLKDEEGGERANLHGANLRGANLHGADLRGADLRGASLYGANLHEANLRGASLYGADLYGADLREANLREANLRGANLHEANLRGASLYGANLYEANLRGADLRGADLRGADLRGANGQNDYFKTITTDIWPVIYTFDRMQIGCENHSITDWKEFDEDRISEMDNNASDFWAKWKDTLFKLIEMNPAQPTGKENT